ncbi:MAG TPA: hypothetical protein VHV77_00155 [Pirellulales bacterium]|jgi:hypothetical protein|nr:hypothetical protein [Pirellulales bacterium]
MKRPISTGERWAFVGVLVLSLLGNAYQGLQNVSLKMGGGQVLNSSDGRAFADVQYREEHFFLNPAFKTTWGELRFQAPGTHADDEAVKLIITPSGGQYGNTNAYRELDEPIRFSDDSRTVTFQLPHVTLSVTPDPNY